MNGAVKNIIARMKPNKAQQLLISTFQLYMWKKVATAFNKTSLPPTASQLNI